jgi:hypothetical protein
MKTITSTRGDIGVFVAVMMVALLFTLAAMFQLSLAAFTTGAAWDVRRQRTVELHSVQVAVKEAVLAKIETAPVQSLNSLVTELTNRVSSVADAGVTITGSLANNAIVLPSNPQWPTATPIAAAVPDFTTTALSGIGRNLQGILSAGDIADLGTRTFSFTETSTSNLGETPTYQVSVRLFSVPLSNFTWIAYGQPDLTGGVVTNPPTPPSFPATGPALGNSYTSPLVHAYAVGQSGTFATMFSGTGTDLPYFYRDLVGLTWNAFEYWTSLTYQDSLLTAAGVAQTFDFGAPGVLPSGVTWDGTRATLDIRATTSSVIVFVDATGGGIVRLIGGATTATPVVVGIRNFTSTPTTIEIATNNARTVLLYAPNSAIRPLAANLNWRGEVLLFGNSSVAAPGMTVNGSVAYPQSFVSPPALTASPDAQAQQDLEQIAPRALFVSTRGTL